MPFVSGPGMIITSGESAVFSNVPGYFPPLMSDHAVIATPCPDSAGLAARAVVGSVPATLIAPAETITSAVTAAMAGSPVAQEEDASKVRKVPQELLGAANDSAKDGRSAKGPAVTPHDMSGMPKYLSPPGYVQRPNLGGLSFNKGFDSGIAPTPDVSNVKCFVSDVQVGVVEMSAEGYLEGYSPGDGGFLREPPRDPVTWKPPDTGQLVEVAEVGPATHEGHTGVPQLLAVDTAEALRADVKSVTFTSGLGQVTFASCQAMSTHPLSHMLCLMHPVMLCHKHPVSQQFLVSQQLLQACLGISHRLHQTLVI
jgi:hypothetical protein